jgi:hypothetical protein
MIRHSINKALWLFVHKIPWKPILIWGPCILLILIATFYAIENWRGARAWEQAEKKAKAAGISLNYRDYLPPAETEGLDLSILPEFNSVNLTDFRQRSTNGESSLNSDRKVFRNRDRWQAKPIDITTWLAPSNPPSDKEEAALRLTEIAKTDLSKLEEIISVTKEKQLVGTSRGDFSSTQDIMSGLYMTTLGMASLASEDALIALAQQDSERALGNIRFLLRLFQIEGAPNFMNLLIKIFILITAEDTIWEACHTQQLNLFQYKTLRDALAKVELEEVIVQNLQGEMAFQLTSLEEIRTNRERLQSTFELFSTGFTSRWAPGVTPIDEALSKIDSLLYRLIPGGWIDRLKAHSVQVFSPMATTAEFNFAKLETITQYNLASGSKLPVPISEMSELIWSPNYLRKIARGIANFHLTRIGVDLEIFRLQNKRYPKTLAELPNSYPNDPFSGEPFRYRLKDDQTPIVWSIGENQVDEGGLPGFVSEEGDLVWQLTPIPGLSKSDLKKKLSKHRLN